MSISVLPPDAVKEAQGSVRAAARFDTDLRYTCRASKAEYVWRKYARILTGRVLDVGADECHLRTHLPAGVAYTGIGLGGQPDYQVDLEHELIPFQDHAFDCVLCLDVLEHLDNPHAVFDELCRVSRQYVIVSLPNPWASFQQVLRTGFYAPGRAQKYYGLPVEPPPDRHKWFFGASEAKRFIAHRAALRGFNVVQMDIEGLGVVGVADWGAAQPPPRPADLSTEVDPMDLVAGPLWAVLERPQQSNVPRS